MTYNLPKQYAIDALLHLERILKKSEKRVLTIPTRWCIVVNVNGKRPQSLHHQIKPIRKETQDDNNE